MPNVFTATKYYLSSIPTLLTKTNFLAIPISILQTETLIRAGGLKLLVRDLMDIWTIKEVILDHQYEHYQQIGQNDTVVDIGGGVGDFSIKAGAKAKIVYSYEIDPNRLSLFYKNLKLNGSEKVTVIEKKALSLDQILDENQITKCDFFKIDCEGCEYEILLNSSP